MQQDDEADDPDDQDHDLVDRGGQLEHPDDEPHDVTGARGVSPREFLAWQDGDPARQIQWPRVSANANAMRELREALAAYDAAKEPTDG